MQFKVAGKLWMTICIHLESSVWLEIMWKCEMVWYENFARQVIIVCDDDEESTQIVWEHGDWKNMLIRMGRECRI